MDQSYYAHHKIPLDQSINILGISGSMREQSFCFRTLEIIGEMLCNYAVNYSLIDPRKMILPFCNGNKQDPYIHYPDVEVLRKRVKQADGIIFISPEYHGSVSGVLKNLIDLLSYTYMENKVVGLVSILGGECNSNTLNHLRIISRHLHGWVIPEQVAIKKSRSTFTEDGILKDEEIAARISNFVDCLINSTTLFKANEQNHLFARKSKQPRAKEIIN